MRKNVKFLLACAVLAGAGMVLMGIGLATGGVVHGIEVDAHGIRVYAPALEKGKGSGTDAAGTYVRREEQLEAFDSVKLDVEYADIRVERFQSDTYALSYSLQEGRNFEKEVKDGKLVLKHTGTGTAGVNVTWFFFGRNTGTIPEESITIYLPKDVTLADVELKTGFGDIVCENIQAADVGLHTDFGDITCKNMQAADVGLYAGSGNVVCEGIYAGRLKTDAAYGNVGITDAQAQEMEASLQSGRLKLEQVQAETCSVKNAYGDAAFYDVTLSGDLEVQMESGDIRLRNTDIRNFGLKSAYGDVDGQQAAFRNIQMSMESGDCRLEAVRFDNCKIRSAYGSVDLQLEREVTDYGYQLETSYGAIRIAGKKMGDMYASLDKSTGRLIEVFCESGDIQIQ